MFLEHCTKDLLPVNIDYKDLFLHVLGLCAMIIQIIGLFEEQEGFLLKHTSGADSMYIYIYLSHEILFLKFFDRKYSTELSIIFQNTVTDIPIV